MPFEMCHVCQADIIIIIRSYRYGYINIRNSYFLHYFYYFYFMRDKVKHYSCFQYLKSIFLIGHDAYYDDYRS